MNTHKTSVFSGVATALITPFSGGEIDRAAFRRLLRRQIDGGIAACVVCGTTGEASTLTDEERELLIEEALEEIGGRIPLIVGTGSNNTARALYYTREAAGRGADAVLVVTPYYNKGTKQGITEHFLRIADASSVPVILYNVPSRTGVDLTIEQYGILAKHPNIVGVKEAKSDMQKIASIRKECGKDFAVYTGNDADFLPTLSLGGRGVISVLSNLFPRETMEAYRLFQTGHPQEAAGIMQRFSRMTDLLFRDVNPAPVKCAMALEGECTPEARLPMTGVSPELSLAIRQELVQLHALEK